MTGKTIKNERSIAPLVSPTCKTDDTTLSQVAPANGRRPHPIKKSCDKMQQISRRSVLYFAAVAPASAVSADPLVADADTLLIELGGRFDAISAQLDRELGTEWTVLEEFDRVLARIVTTRANTMEGLFVKARAGCWALLGDFESADESAAGAPMAFSIMRDLIRLGAPNLENPGALRRLFQQIEDDAN